MAPPKTTTTPTDTPKTPTVIAPVLDAAPPPAVPNEVEAIRLQLVAAERERDAAQAERDRAASEREALRSTLELVEARDRERAAEAAASAKLEREVTTEPRRVLGTIPIYNDDQPGDVVKRAREVMAGQIPADKATRFRTDANVRAPKGSKLTERFRAGELVPIGTELHRDDVDAETRAHWAAQGSIIPIG